MPITKAHALISLAASLIAGCCSASASAGARPEAAYEIANLTKTTTATYSLYLWNRISEPGEPIREEWSAEFHKGDFHRVETPRHRIIANCAARTGTYIALDTGRKVEGVVVAAAACGINSNANIQKLSLLGDFKTAFGNAKRIQIIDDQHIREYDISPQGALLRTTYAENRPKGQLLIVAEAKRYELTVPDNDMFSVESLERSYLPTSAKK